jgi:hypothetical protein
LPRKCITLLDHDLVTDSPTSRIEVNPMRVCKSFDLAVLFEILGGLVLYIVVEGEDELSRVCDLASSYTLESTGNTSAR